MACSGALSCVLPPSNTWDSLVFRSIEALKALADNERKRASLRLDIECWQNYGCLDGFLCKAPVYKMFSFFQRRDAFFSQTKMMKWSRTNLDKYVLLPCNLVSRKECFFVSHFWDSQDHPDPKGHCLRLHQTALQPLHWSYIWIDWTCMPQSPRSEAEERYFIRSLETMSGLVRNCGFNYFYPPFEARLWILYEIAEYLLTSEGGWQPTPDIREFMDHVREMVRTSVQSVLDKYSYKCTQDRDKAFLTSWLEVLVLLQKLSIGIFEIRRILDRMTWSSTVKDIHIWGILHLSKFKGTLVYNGNCYTFTPFPEWDEGKYSAKFHRS